MAYYRDLIINGEEKRIKIAGSGGSGDVADVYVDGESVLDENKIAQIDLTGKENKHWVGTKTEMDALPLEEGKVYETTDDNGGEKTAEIITVDYSANTSVTGGSYFNFNRIQCQVGNKLTLTNGKIKIGSGIHHILVSASATGDYASSFKRIILRKNETDLCGVFSSNADSSSYLMGVLHPRLVEVEENDEIALYNRDNTFTAWYFGTYMTVQVID